MKTKGGGVGREVTRLRGVDELPKTSENDPPSLNTDGSRVDSSKILQERI